MSGNEPFEDPSEAPTGMYDYGERAQGSPTRSAPWYRKPILSLAVGLFVAILIGVVIYLLADQTQGDGSTKQTPTSPTTTAPVSTTQTSTSIAPAPPPETTTVTFPPTTTEPTSTAPTTTPPTTTSVDEGHHHHHHHDSGTP